MSTIFFDDTTDNDWATTPTPTFSQVYFCPLKRIGSSFSVPAGTWVIDTIQLGLDRTGWIGQTWQVNLDIYTDNGSGAPGSLVGHLLINSPLTIGSSSGNDTFLQDFSSLITPVTITGGTRYWLLVQDQGSTGTQTVFADWISTPIYPSEYTADCSPSINTLNNPPMIMLVGGSPPASPPTPKGQVNTQGRLTKAGIKQMLIAVPEFHSHEEARQVIAKALNDLQLHIASQLPVTNNQGQRLSNVGPPVAADDVVTLKYLQSVYIPPLTGTKT